MVTMGAPGFNMGIENLYGATVMRETVEGVDTITVPEEPCQGMEHFARQALLKKLQSRDPVALGFYRNAGGGYVFVDHRGKKDVPSIEEAPFALVLFRLADRKGALKMITREGAYRG